MKIKSHNKIFQYWICLLVTILFSCSPTCPPIEKVKKEGNKVVISMIECGTSKSIFDIKLNLDVIENPNDSLSKKRYIHIPKEEIQINTKVEFDYQITVSRINYLGFKIRVMIKEGNNNIEIEGTNFEKNEQKGAASITFAPGITSFTFEGKIEELKNNVYQTEIKSSRFNDASLNIFNETNANFNENYSIVLSILE